MSRQSKNSKKECPSTINLKRPLGSFTLTQDRRSLKDWKTKSPIFTPAPTTRFSSKKIRSLTNESKRSTWVSRSEGGGPKSSETPFTTLSSNSERRESKLDTSTFVEMFLDEHKEVRTGLMIMNLQFGFQKLKTPVKILHLLLDRP